VLSSNVEKPALLYRFASGLGKWTQLQAVEGFADGQCV
jgi:hypothetical protein